MIKWYQHIDTDINKLFVIRIYSKKCIYIVFSNPLSTLMPHLPLLKAWVTEINTYMYYTYLHIHTCRYLLLQLIFIPPILLIIFPLSLFAISMCDRDILMACLRRYLLLKFTIYMRKHSCFFKWNNFLK